MLKREATTRAGHLSFFRLSHGLCNLHVQSVCLTAVSFTVLLS